MIDISCCLRSVQVQPPYKFNGCLWVGHGYIKWWQLFDIDRLVVTKDFRFKRGGNVQEAEGSAINCSTCVYCSYRRLEYPIRGCIVRVVMQFWAHGISPDGELRFTFGYVPILLPNRAVCHGHRDRAAVFGDVAWVEPFYLSLIIQLLQFVVMCFLPQRGVWVSFGVGRAGRVWCRGSKRLRWRYRIVGAECCLYCYARVQGWVSGSEVG